MALAPGVYHQRRPFATVRPWASKGRTDAGMVRQREAPGDRTFQTGEPALDRLLPTSEPPGNIISA